MKEIKILKTLSQFSNSDLDKFEDFLQSPYLVKNLDYYTFYLFIKEFGFPNIILEKDRIKIWGKIYPAIKYQDSKWRTFCNSFLNVITSFFIQEQLKTNKYLNINLLLTYIQEKDVNTLKNSSLQSTLKELNKNVLLSSEIHYYKYEFEKNIYDLLDFEVNIEMQSNLAKVHKELDLFYLSEKIKLIVNARSRIDFVKLQIELDLEEEIINIIKSNDYLKHPEIALYYNMFLLKKENSVTKYYEIKQDILNNLSKLSNRDSIDILKEILNFCNVQLNNGQSAFAFEAMNWYKYGLKHDLIFSEHNRFIPGYFLNIVISGIRTKEFAWTENFIEDYKKKIPNESKKDIVTFSYARLYFNQQKFNDVIEKLRDVEFDEISYNLDAKVLLLATYFEVDEWPAMTSLAESYRTYLNRHEKDITKAKQLRYLNFIKFIKKLSRVKYQDKKAKEKLIVEIQAVDGVVNKGWLVEKARAI